ncbi:MAG TPA: hypothetical protein VL095_02085 [Flavisolibacter sp.]|nr:hypothetical protein [Flavisolibacter sp.]
MKKILILAVAASSFLFACDKEKNKDKVYKSEESTLHNGKVWTSAKVDKDGKPVSVSIVVNDAALNSVPVGQPSDHMSPANNLLIPFLIKAERRSNSPWLTGTRADMNQTRFILCLTSIFIFIQARRPK